MSFIFKWPQFSDDFHRDARQMLEGALNKGNKPPIIADKIEVVELEMGTQPPELEIRDIGDLTLDQFRGIFRLSYAGDAHIVLRTKVQANPLNHKRPDIHMVGGFRGMLAAQQPLVVPMLLRLSHFKLNAYVVLVVSKQKGITLVFKTDPLQNVDVNSTFDSIAVIQKYIQREIEGQLREMFREDLPGIIHRLSQRWIAGKTKVETPYLPKQQQRSTPGRTDIQDRFTPCVHHPASMMGKHPSFRRQSLSSVSSPQWRQGALGLLSETSINSAPSSATSSPSFSAPAVSHDQASAFPDIENYDPTYGLRPDDLPAKSGYSGFGRLFEGTKGLGDLMEVPSKTVAEWEEADSFDMVDWEETVNFSRPPSVVSEDTTEYETLPAVGGGTITRPRIYHSQSMIRTPVDGLYPVTISALSSTSARSPSGLATLGNEATLSGPMAKIPVPEIHQSFYLPSWHNCHRGQGTSLWMPRADLIDNRSRLIRPASFAGATTSGMLADDLARWSMSPDRNDLTSSRHTGSHIYLSNNGQMGVPSTSPEASHGHTPTRPSTVQDQGRGRSLSSSSFLPSDGIKYGSPPNFRSAMDADGNIILRPGQNNTISQLSTLSYSNHTLSPYTRSLEHFTVRTVPHKASGFVPVADRQPTKAKRKRTYRLGGRKPSNASPNNSPPSSPPPPSEFEASDVEHYFPVPPPGLRERTSYRDP